MDYRKSIRRQGKIEKRKNGHQVDNRNIFILEEEKRKKSNEIKRKRKEKENNISI